MRWHARAGADARPDDGLPSANARTQRDVSWLLAPAIDLMLTAAYAQCGLQSVGIRYYPLPVDTIDGTTPEHWAASPRA